MEGKTGSLDIMKCFYGDDVLFTIKYNYIYIVYYYLVVFSYQYIYDYKILIYLNIAPQSETTSQYFSILALTPLNTS